MIRRVVLAALAFVAAAAAFAAPPLPDAVTRDFPALKEAGDTRFRFLGIHVYDISLWTTGASWKANELHALQLIYQINIKGSALTERSIKEMRGQGWNDEAKLKKWEADMKRVFPDLKPGDRLVGVNTPGKGARFYNAGGALGSVDDPEFAKAFFDIWLDEKTSQPGMRSRLLKLPQ